MSLNISGEKCAFCKAYLFEEDDVVYCPECGAPHHRDCYNELGHCALEDLHGTENQYKRPEPQSEKPTEKVPETDGEIICGMCGEKYSINEQVCPKCNTPNMVKSGQRYIKIDFLGGVPANTDLGDGVTADEAKKFVAVNTQRYIPKFLKFKSGKKSSWNWLAFLFPGAWFLSRKMNLLGAVITTLQVAFSMFLIPFTNAVSFLDLANVNGYTEYAALVFENISKIGTTVIYLSFIGMVLQLVLRILCGIFGDYLYKRRVTSAVTEIKTSVAEDSVGAYRKKGGVSLAFALLGILIVEYFPTLLATLI